MVQNENPWEQGTILSVEDDPQDVEIIRLALTRLESPYALATVTDGRQAIQYLSRTGEYADRKRFRVPFLVLLDLSLPQVSGFEVLSWMRGEPPEKTPPVVVLSYSRLERDRHLAHRLGAKGYYVKSPDLDATVALFKSLLVLSWLPPVPA